MIDFKRKLDEGIAFFRGFVKKPQEVGSVIPSSSFVERRIIEAAGVPEARSVVELGPGTGGTTRAILHALPSDGRLLAVEISPRFHARARTIADPRLTAHLGSAADLPRILAEHDFPPPDAVLSGIPFSTMEREAGLAIVQAIAEALAPGGRFVAYQIATRVQELGERVFGPAEVEVELRNVPPTRIYRWVKEG